MESGKVGSVVGSRCDSSRASDGIKSFTMCALGCFRVVVHAEMEAWFLGEQYGIGVVNIEHGRWRWFCGGSPTMPVWMRS